MDKTLDELVKESRTAAAVPPSRPAFQQGGPRGGFRPSSSSSYGGGFRGGGRGGGYPYSTIQHQNGALPVRGRPRPGYQPIASRYNPIAQQRPGARGMTAAPMRGGRGGGGGRFAPPPVSPASATLPRLIICDNCMGRGHIFHNCGEALSCFACGETTHEKAACPVLVSGMLCTYCGKAGHSEARCKTHAMAQWRNDIAQNSAAATMTGEGGELIAEKRCYCCGSTEHEKIDCPAKAESCDKCGMQGHLKATCRR